MNLLLLFILFFVSPVFSEITLDTEYLEEIVKKHPNDNETRLLLASYYLKIGELEKSDELIKVALTQEKNNKNALNLQKKWHVAKKYDDLVKQLNINNLNDTKAVDLTIKKQYEENNFDSLRLFFSLLEEKNVTLSKESQIIFASVLVEKKEHEKALEVIDLIPNQSDKRIQNLLASTCIALKNTECAVNSLQKLFNSSGDLDSGLELADALIQQGRIIDARNVAKTLNKKHKKSSKIASLSNRLDTLFNERALKQQKSFQGKATVENVKNYSAALFDKGNKEKAYLVLLKFIKQNPKDDGIKLFTAKRYAINRDYTSAISLLQSMNQKTPKNQLLQAQYLSWAGGQSEKTRNLLKDLLNQAKETKDPAYTQSIVNDATLLLGNSYLWEGDKAKAMKTLEPLAKSDTSSSAVKEAYLLAKNQYSPLINKYEKRLKETPENVQLILRLANLHQSAKHNSKALQYYEQYKKMNPLDTKVEKAMGLLYLTQKKYDPGFRLLKRNAYRVHTEDELLNLANNYHWNGFNVDALDVIAKIESFYPHSKGAAKLKKKVIKAPLDGRNKQLAAANKAYQKKEYKAATPLFKQYLRKFPSDYFVRQKYAFALGQAGSYTKAAKEFSLIAQAKPDDLNAQYHYAYNLELSDNGLKAEEVYKNIIKNTEYEAEKEKELPIDKKTPKAKLHELAGLRLAAVEKNKDVMVNGISLGGGVKKVLEPEHQVFSNSIVAPAQRNKNKTYSSFVAEDVLYYSPRDVKRIMFDYQYASDKIGVEYHNPQIKAQYNTWPYEINFVGGGFRFEDKDEYVNKDGMIEACDAEYGGSVELSGMYKHSASLEYGGGLKVDQFDGETEFSPFLNTRLTFDKSNIDLQIYKRSLFYEKLSCNALKKHLNKYGAQVSGNIEFTKKQALWYSIDAGYIDDNNDNVEIIPQFDLTLYQDKWANKYAPVDYEITLSGYYVWNKNQTDDYYSPEFFDSTSIGFHPTVHITKNFEITSVGTVGYSFDASSLTYSYGLWAQYSINKSLKAKAGCERSNIGSSSAVGENSINGSDYHSNNCLATLEYEWR